MRLSGWSGHSRRLDWRFREENGAVFQYVDNTASPLVSVQDFSASADGEDALRAWCLEQAARPDGDFGNTALFFCDIVFGAAGAADIL